MFLSIALRSALLASADIGHLGDDCQVTPVIHVLQYPGCVPKPIPSFACVGRCASYIQVGIESQSINQFNHNPLILSPLWPARCRAARSGKWSVPVCAARSRASVRRPSRCSVPRSSMVSVSSRKSSQRRRWSACAARAPRLKNRVLYPRRSLATRTRVRSTIIFDELPCSK